MTRVCPKCKNEFPDNIKVCPYCQVKTKKKGCFIATAVYMALEITLTLMFFDIFEIDT